MSVRSVSTLLSKAAQMLALFCLLAYFLRLAHKAFIHISALLISHPDNFWVALGRYFLRNLGGG